MARAYITTAAIAAVGEDLPVLMHSCLDWLSYVERSHVLGAAGYIIKGPNTTVLINAVRIAFSGGNVRTPDQLRHAANSGAAS